MEGDAYPLEISPSPRDPACRLRVEDAPPAAWRPVRTGPFRPARVELEIRMPRRGRHVLEGAAWRVGDPLGLHSRELPAPPGGELLVLPRLEPVSARGPASVDGGGVGAPRGGEEGAAQIREARAVEFEVDGLRPYREGSPASRIHWPAVARSGEMHERRILAGAEATPLVALDAEYPAVEALDRAVGQRRPFASIWLPGPDAACSCRGAARPQRRTARLRAWPALHARFAVVGSGAPTRLPSRAAGLRGSVFWVTAGRPDRRASRGSRERGSTTSSARSSRPALLPSRWPGCFGTAVSARAAARTRVAA